MRPRCRVRTLSAVLAAGLLSACGSDTPSAPSGGASTSLQIATGAQILRVTYQGPACVTISGERLTAIPFVYTPVTVSRAGSEWVAVASDAGAGTVELRVHETSSGPAGAFYGGTIKGTAIHVPAVEGGPTTWDARVNFGSDGRSVLTGVLFPLSPGSSTGAFDGIGTGSIALSDGAGRSCTGTSFSWALFPKG